MSRFDYFIKKHQPAIGCALVSEETIQRYQGILPDGLLDHWRTMGWCGYGKGLIWVVNPDDFRDTLKEWLGPAAEGAHAVARTAFGNIAYVNDEGTYYIDVHLNMILKQVKNVEAFFWLTLCDNDFLNNVLDRKRFQQALSRLGVLEPDECYAYAPALALGGPGTAETLIKVKMMEHLSILAQLRDSATKEMR
jgi:hypothetical protein